MAAAATAFVGLGGNLGDARAAVLWALAELDRLPGTRLVRASSLYRSAPVDAGGPDYVNAVAKLATHLAPLDLLDALQALELQAGRERPYVNAPRTLDLDVLLYADRGLELPRLTLPHPRMWQRAFVLRPLAEIEPGLVPQGALETVSDQQITRCEK
ncbi:2-amino-4-hydroxy-6-hydroxymethyldihydropteridinediphosphokinase [Pseudorhodoferax sp. LjRoot39]|uniref:2-amino-4-hydroxy-6- hydroxymethyldihydropteridine diphosphokinase n=1 Tax=Pseudorhodoferax sp. LjRoot39 TaxID=3342328 RepID=UPI003ECC2063